MVDNHPKSEDAKAPNAPPSAGLGRMNSKFRPGRIIPVNLRTVNTAESESVANLELSPKKGDSRPGSRDGRASFSRRDSFGYDESDGTVSEAGSKSPPSFGSSHSGASQSQVGNGYSHQQFPSTHDHRRTASSNERILELRGPGKRSWMPSSQSTGANGPSLIVRRLQKTKEKQSPQALEESQLGLRELQQTFAARQSSLDHVNWEFWAMLVGDYDNIARNQPVKLKQAIQNGFPSELRGLLWQVISSSKSSALEQLYYSLIQTQDAPCTTAINKDLDRTPMAKNVDHDSLARLLTAYSLFDPEVGYTQGMAFIVVPLLMELSEAEAFSLFVQLMKTYDFRSVFMADMPGLHLKLYQFDRMIEDTLESVHTHLKRQGVQSSMYASQWFLTMFAYRFPPSLVTRIFDIVIAEGMEALLRFALSLMQAAAPTILELHGLDELLPFLKEKIFDRFEGSENELVKLASNVELLPQVLSKFELEHQELNRLEKERMEQMDTLRSSNARLTLQNKQLEASLESLNLEHIQIANKMVSYGMELSSLRDENHDLSEKLNAVSGNHEMLGDLTAELKAKDTEIAILKRENEAMQRELALLKKSQEILHTAELVKSNEHLREVNKRYELQLGSLQESLASALEGH